MNIEECLRMGYLRRVRSDQKLIEKELNEAKYDLDRAKHAIEEEDHKWCIIKCYCAMFHAIRGILFSLGYKEKRHFAVQIVLEDLVKNGRLESIYLNYFSAAMECREDADYRYQYSEEVAREMIGNTEKFLFRVEQLLNVPEI